MDKLIAPINANAHARYEAALKGIVIPPPSTAANKIEISEGAINNFVKEIIKLLKQQQGKPKDVKSTKNNYTE